MTKPQWVQALGRSRVELKPGSVTRIPAGTPLCKLGLSTRAHNVLRRAGIHSIEEACKLSAEQIRSFRNAGAVTALEVLDALTAWKSTHPFTQRR